MDQNRLADLREKLEEIRAKRGDDRPVGPHDRAARATGRLDGKSRFVVVAAVLMAVLYYFLL